MKRRHKIFVRAALLAIGFLTGCGDSNGPHKPIAMKPETQKEKADTSAPGIGFAQVRGIFARQCSACHPSRNGPDWLDYNQAKRYAENGLLFRRIVSEHSMPPPRSPQSASITAEERAIIGRWAESGGPMDAPARAPDQKGGQSGPVATTISPAETSDPAVLPVARQCLQCHGLDGPQAGSRLKIPRLAGQNAKYLYQQLLRFRWRERIDPTNAMNDIAGEPEMTNEAMLKVSEFFAGRPAFGRTEITDLSESEFSMFLRGEALARDNCVQCHMNPAYPRGTSDPSLPALAGQSQQYLRNQLIYFRDNERQSPLMHEYSRRLTNEEIEELSFYFSGVRDSRVPR